VVFAAGIAAALWLPQLAKWLGLDVGQLVAIAFAIGGVGVAASVAFRPMGIRIMRWLG
jgi:hypothetical protein